MADLSDLRDIQNLDPIGIWPLAPGWWLTLVIVTLLLIIVAIKIRKWWRYKNSWQASSHAKLRDILNEYKVSQDVESTLQELSEEIRRIAIKRAGRENCASLTGANWLAWLNANDPGGFDWQKHGNVLIQARYQQSFSATIQVPTQIAEEVYTLISAAKKWVDKC